MQTVILAGGLATRMKPLTENFPKALLPVAGRPFIDHQLKHLRLTGVDSVVLCIGFQGDLIRQHVGDGNEFGLKVSYVDEGAHLRGTAGALRLAADEGALEDRFLITYGDSYLPISFSLVWDEFIKSGKPGIMSVYRNDGAYDKSNVWFENGMIKMYDKFVTSDKPYAKNIHYIDYGLTGLDLKTVNTMIPADVKYDLATVFHELSREGNLAGFESKKRFYEIGSHAGLAELDSLMSKGTPL